MGSLIFISVDLLKGREYFFGGLECSCVTWLTTGSYLLVRFFVGPALDTRDAIVVRGILGSAISSLVLDLVLPSIERRPIS